MCYISFRCKFQWRWIVIFLNFDRRSCQTTSRSQINETVSLKLNDWTLFGLNLTRFEALPVSFFLAGFGLFLSFASMWKVCLLNRTSVRSERTRDKSNHYVSTKEESIHAIKFEKDSQRCKRLCSKKLKSVKFRILAEWNLSFWYNNRFSWFSAFIFNVSKN